jgi:hypothetical protein
MAMRPITTFRAADSTARSKWLVLAAKLSGLLSSVAINQALNRLSSTSAHRPLPPNQPFVCRRSHHVTLSLPADLILHLETSNASIKPRRLRRLHLEGLFCAELQLEEITKFRPWNKDRDKRYGSKCHTLATPFPLED